MGLNDWYNKLLVDIVQVVYANLLTIGIDGSVSHSNISVFGI